MRAVRVFAALILSAALSASVGAQTLDDAILAKVNGEDITRRHLVSRLLEYHGAEALERLVTRTLLLQAAKRHNLTVTPEEEKQKLESIVARFRNEEDYKKFLEQSKLSEKQYQDEIRHTLLVQKVVQKETPITDQDLEQYDVRIILAADKATAEKWIKELVGGAEFREMARTRNGDQNLKAAAGRMQPFLRIQMPELAQAVDSQKLKPLEFTKTPVLLSSNSWAIVRLEARIDAVLGASAVERERLEAAVLTSRIAQWFETNRKKATVEKLGFDKPVVARVNGEAISREQLVVRLLEHRGDEALQQMVNRTMLLQAAKKANLSPNDAEIEKQLADLRGKFKTPQELQEFISKANVPEKQFFDEARYNFLMERVALRESPITEDDLVRYDVRMIVCPNKMLADEWIKELDNGADFKKMARERTQDPEGRKSEGRFKPFLKLEMLDIWRLLQGQKLKPGMYTKEAVLLTDGNWAILKLENLLPVSSATAEEKEIRTKVVRDYRITQWLNQTRSAAAIAFPVPLSAVARGTAG